LQPGLACGISLPGFLMSLQGTVVGKQSNQKFNSVSSASKQYAQLPSAVNLQNQCCLQSTLEKKIFPGKERGLCMPRAAQWVNYVMFLCSQLGWNFKGALLSCAT